jgi:RNA polymerase sigma-70 factor (ECF subfamily)
MPNVDVNAAIEEHYARIYRAALVLTGNPWDADDLAQETFLVLARDGRKFEGRSKLYTWLYGILLNLERRQLRRLGTLRRKLRVIREQESPDAAAVPAAETRLEVREWKNSMWAKVAELPEGQRQALVLRFAEHLSYQEVAETLGCPLGTVKSRIFNGLARLRDMLAEDQGQVTHSPRHASEDLTEVG